MNVNFIGRKSGHSNVLLQQQLNKLVLDKMAEAKKEGVKEAIEMVTAIFMLQLHDKYGFGNKRLENLKSDIDFTIECILSGHVSFEDIKKEVNEKVGKKEVK